MRAELLLGRLSVAVAVFCATAVTVTAVAIAMPSVRGTLFPKQTAPPSYLVGGRIDLPADLLQAAPTTLVVFFRSDCGVCERIKPTLTKLVSRSGGAVHVIAVTGQQQSRPDSEAYVRRIGLDPGRLVMLDLKAVRVRTVPTMVLVDRSGTIRAAVEGVPSSQAQADFVRLMLAPTPVH